MTESKRSCIKLAGLKKHKTAQFESYRSCETFKSKKVRVISKPSKKRQSIRYNELRFDLHLDLE